MGGTIFWLIMGGSLILAAYEWVGLAKQTKRKMLISAAGIIYLIICYDSFISLRLHFESGLYLTLALLLSVWTSDIGAYACGKKFCGPKMIPSISPNKTWAGFIGAAVLSGIMMTSVYLAGPFVTDLFKTELILPFGSPAIAFALGFFITFSGQAGDLLISMLKRRAGAKDSGKLIPGHGGLLDRIDSLLMSSLFFFVAVKLLGH
ncbi:MAG: phosphatidate cytidylyltransferase [Pseudomonadota bacterium]